jgi:hypothetical protein
MMKQLLQLDPARYERHPIHRGERDWAETNCYVDIWIELLHAWGCEPIAALPFTFGIDFEGDQWTFFKFPHGDLFDLYRLDVQELAIWRPLATHVEEQVELGRPVLVELDSFYLPDTAGTAYQIAHVKSTVAIVEIDTAAQHLGYFHGQGYYRLNGADFVNVLRVNDRNPALLPPYVEIVKRRREAPPRGADLVAVSLSILRRQLERLPDENPFEKFKARFQTDLTWLVNESLEAFHSYSFATLRQFGACFEQSATYLRWLRERTDRPLDRAIAAFAELSSGAKTMQFHLARMIARKKPLELAPLDQMAVKWATGMNELKAIYA